MKKKSFLLLCANTNRSKFYLDCLSRRDDIDLEILYYGYCHSDENTEELILPSERTIEYFRSFDYDLPALNCSLTDSILREGIDCTYVSDGDVNSSKILKILNDKNPEYVVFSGYGGQILSKDHFDGDSFYLHCHPGKLPSERGSTTLYYSILNNKDFTVTAFRMTREIDSGTVVYEKSFPRPNSRIDIDLFGDCGMRALTLDHAIDVIVHEDDYRYIPEKKDEEYFVIHPLLKHISILSLK